MLRYLLLFHLSVSLLAVGGAITLVPELHRVAVSEHGWLSELQFNTSVTLAQAAPGPNVLFIALVGWNVGLNSVGPGENGLLALIAALASMLICILGVMVPSSILTVFATRWCRRNGERMAVKAFRQGMSPIVVGILLSTSWLLAKADGDILKDAGLWLLTGACAILIWRTRIHLVWLLAAGAILGGAGLV